MVSLKKAIFVSSIFVGIFGGLFFITPALTGNAVGAMTPNAATGVGVMLIVLGLINAYLWKKNNY